MFARPTDRRWAPHGVTRGDGMNGDLCGGHPGKGRVGRGLAWLGIAESEPLRLDLGSGCRGPHHLTRLSWLIRVPVWEASVTGELERAGGGCVQFRHGLITLGGAVLPGQTHPKVSECYKYRK